MGKKATGFRAHTAFGIHTEEVEQQIEPSFLVPLQLEGRAKVQHHMAAYMSLYQDMLIGGPSWISTSFRVQAGAHEPVLRAPGMKLPTTSYTDLRSELWTKGIPANGVLGVNVAYASTVVSRQIAGRDARNTTGTNGMTIIAKRVPREHQIATGSPEATLRFAMPTATRTTTSAYTVHAITRETAHVDIVTVNVCTREHTTPIHSVIVYSRIMGVGSGGCDRFTNT